MEKIQESQAVAAASDSESAECEGNTCARQVEHVDEIKMPSKAEQKIQELNADAAAATSSNTTSVSTAHESITTHAAESKILVPTQMQEGGTTNRMKNENALQKDEAVLEKGRPAHIRSSSRSDSEISPLM